MFVQANNYSSLKYVNEKNDSLTYQKMNQEINTLKEMFPEYETSKLETLFRQNNSNIDSTIDELLNLKFIEQKLTVENKDISNENEMEKERGRKIRIN